MKRFSKVIAFALLLAVVVSAFGVFSAFAAEPTESSRIIVFNMDERSTVTLSNPTATNSGTASLTKVTDGDDVWWTYAGGVGNANDYFSNGTVSDIYVASKTTTDETTGEIKEVSGKVKNTNYMVYDLDVSTSTQYPSELMFYMPFCKNEGTTSAATSVRTGLLQMRIAYEDGYLVVKNNCTGTYAKTHKAKYPTASDRDWQDVTIVFDYTDYDTSTYCLNSVTYYVYIDGFLCGSEKVTEGVLNGGKTLKSEMAPSTYKNIYAFRTDLEVVSETDSLNMANYTFSRFDETYTGSFGKMSNFISDHPELAYTLEDKPANSAPIATITSETDTERNITCYSVDDIQKNVQAGDTITLKYSVFDLILIPDDANANTKSVKLVDTNGVAVGDEAALVSAPGLYEVDTANIDWAIIDGSNNVTVGTTTEENTYYNETEIVDALLLAIKSVSDVSNCRVVLFDDITMLCLSEGATGVYYDIDFNLNGHTLNVDIPKVTVGESDIQSHIFSAQNGKTIRFTNGTLNFNKGNGKNLVYYNNTAGRTIFYRATVNLNASTIIDQRTGYVVYSRCVANVNGGVMTSTKSSNGKEAYLYVYKTQVEGDGAVPISVANISKSGSANNNIYVKDSSFDTKSSFIQNTERVQTASTTSADAKANNNNLYINILNSSITTKDSFLYDVPEWQARFTATEDDTRSVDSDVTVNMSGTTVAATNYFYNRGLSARTYYCPADYVTVTYDVIFNVYENCKVSAGAALANKVHDASGEGKTEYDFVKVVMNFNEGTLLNYTKVHTDCETEAPVANAEAGSEIAFTNTNDGYNHIVTSNYTTNTYTKGTAVVDEEFYWNIAENEEIIMEWVTDLAETVAYKYTWATAALENGTAYTATLAPNFTPSVSMSTDGTLALNLFLPTEVYTALGGENVNFASALGYEIDKALDADLGQYGKEGTFVQAKVMGIDPSKANETAVTVTFNIIGAYGDSIEKSIDVSVVSYAKMVIKNGTAAEKQYAVQLLNYVKAVIAYIGEDTTAITAIDNIIAESGLTVNAGNVGEAAAGGKVTGIDEFAMNLGGSINWVLTVSGNDTYTVSYTRDGETVTVERTAENGEIVISLRAYDALGTVTVTNNSDNTSSTFNIANYYATQGENAKAVLTALAAYASEAAAYKVQLDAAN